MCAMTSVECKELRHIDHFNTKLLFYGMFFQKITINRIKGGGVKVTFSTLLANFRLYIFGDVKAIS